MGANAQTAVPKFTAGQVLTAAQQTQINTGVPVFATTTTRDAAFGGSNKTLAQGQLCYIEADNKVYVYSGSAWVSISSVPTVATFTTSGTWTVPAGVTYAVAYIRAGGGGNGTGSSGTGGTSSVAFAGGTVSATGGPGINSAGVTMQSTSAGAANSGEGATGWAGISGTFSANMMGGRGALITAGAAVTPGASITITVGAGGTAGTSGSAGGSGYIYIEY